MKEVIDEMSHSLDSPERRSLVQPEANLYRYYTIPLKREVGHHSETCLDKKLEFCHPLIELLQFEMQKIGVSAEEQSSGV